MDIKSGKMFFGAMIIFVVMYQASGKRKGAILFNVIR
jgi:hypothetical protein